MIHFHQSLSVNTRRDTPPCSNAHSVAQVWDESSPEAELQPGFLSYFGKIKTLVDYRPCRTGLRIDAVFSTVKLNMEHVLVPVYIDEFTCDS